MYVFKFLNNVLNYLFIYLQFTEHPVRYIQSNIVLQGQLIEIMHYLVH